MTKKFYNYIVYPQTGDFTFDNPLSSMRYSNAEQAYIWAERLMDVHPYSASVSFRADNGIKIYFIARQGDNSRIRGKYNGGKNWKSYLYSAL